MPGINREKLFPDISKEKSVASPTSHKLLCKVESKYLKIVFWIGIILIILLSIII